MVRGTRWIGALLLVTLLIPGCLTSRSPGPAPEARYYADDETIDSVEANRLPPADRWPVLKSLAETADLQVLCYPKSTAVNDAAAVAKIVKAVQASTYVAVGQRPNGEPDVKAYFRRKDGSFIMAAKVHLKEGVLDSPEGPLLKVDVQALQHLVEDGVCLQ